MAGWQALSRPPAAEGGGRRPAFTGLATQPYSATEVDGWQHKAQPGVSKPGRSTLRAYDSVSEARASIGRYLNFYNVRRPHSRSVAPPSIERLESEGRRQTPHRPQSSCWHRRRVFLGEGWLGAGRRLERMGGLHRSNGTVREVGRLRLTALRRSSEQPSFQSLSRFRQSHERPLQRLGRDGGAADCTSANACPSASQETLLLRSHRLPGASGFFAPWQSLVRAPVPVGLHRPGPSSADRQKSRHRNTGAQPDGHRACHGSTPHNGTKDGSRQGCTASTRSGRAAL